MKQLTFQQAQELIQKDDIEHYPFPILNKTGKAHIRSFHKKTRNTPASKRELQPLYENAESIAFSLLHNDLVSLRFHDSSGHAAMATISLSLKPEFFTWAVHSY